MAKITQEMEAVFDSVADYFALLSGPARLRIMHALCDGEKTVSDIVQITGLSQANTSQHLALMHRTRTLSRRREGTSVYYKIADPKAVEICRFVSVLVVAQMGEVEDVAFAGAASGPAKSKRKVAHG